MRCAICEHGETIAGETTVTLVKEGSTSVFKNVPALVCDHCGEVYVAEEIRQKLLASMQMLAGGEGENRNGGIGSRELFFEEITKLIG